MSKSDLITVRVISAIGGGVIECNISQQGSVQMLKNQVAGKKRIPSESIVIVFRGRQLDESLSLTDAGIVHNDKIYLITRTEGGILSPLLIKI